MKRTWQNNSFALREIWRASHTYLLIYFGATVLCGLLEFFTGAYLLRKIVNAVEAGQGLSELVTYVAVLMTVTIISYLALNWFWHVTSPKIEERIAMQIQKKIYLKASEVELACYETPAFYDKYVRAMDEAYHRMMQVLNTMNTLLKRMLCGA